MYEEPLALIKFGYDSAVVVDFTRGTMDCKLKCSTVDPVGFGVGDTVRETVLSLCNSLRRTADEIEEALEKHYEVGDAEV
jgi:hypothetical protein